MQIVKFRRNWWSETKEEIFNLAPQVSSECLYFEMPIEQDEVNKLAFLLPIASWGVFVSARYSILALQKFTLIYFYSS